MVNTPQSLVISYPKSGRTWLRLMMGKTICSRFGIPDEYSLNIRELTARARLRVTDFSHDQTDIRKGLHFADLKSDKSSYAGLQVLFLTRNAKDLLVSCYFQATRRIGRRKRFDGSISQFIRDDRFGIRKILAFYNIWYENRRIPAIFTHTTYERMHEDPKSTLITALRLTTLLPTESEVRQSVEFSRFENMKRLEKEGFFRTHHLMPTNRSDPESFKTRKGKVGGYADYLAPEDIAYIDELEVAMGNPFREAPLANDGKDADSDLILRPQVPLKDN